MSKTGVAIVGASGYAARELAHILLNHPNVAVTAATSRQDESPRLDALHPSLARRTNLRCEPFDAQRIADKAEFAMLALPHTASMAVVPDLLRLGVKVIDLSADYRLSDPRTYADWYGHEHSDPENLSHAVYGLPELFRERIPPARLIANPGCYTSTSILALAPLVARGLIDTTGVIIDAKSGVSGAGRSPKLGTHFPECNESLAAYGVGRHRHTPEIEQVLTTVARDRAGADREGGPAASASTSTSVDVIFTPHLVPMDRGILATIYARPKGAVAEHDVMALYRSFYEEAPFVRVVDHLPATKDSAHTNYCDISARVVKGRILVFACLDNLIKGAAGVAVQNLNLMLGLPEETGFF